MTNSQSKVSESPVSRSSLAWRLTRMVVPSLATLIVVGGLALYVAMKNLLISQFDQTLLAKARTLTRLAGEEQTGINLSFTDDPLPEFQADEDAEYFQVWLNNGSVLAKSPSLGEDQELPRISSSGTSPEFLPLTLPDRRSGRAVALRLGSRDGAGSEQFVVDMTLARSSEDLNRVLLHVVIGMVAGGTALLILVWIVVRRATKAGLRPVEELARQVGDIDADSLESRIRVESLPLDLQPIGRQINGLMMRLDAAFARERRFASNAAHELLTPVSELKVAADNALDWPDDSRATADLAKDASELAAEMEHVVRSLLALSRAEADLTPFHKERFDLTTTIRDMLDSHAEAIAAKSLHLECELPARAEWVSDEVIVRSILNNLLTNAADYSSSGTPLIVSLRHQQDEVEIVVENQAESVRPEDIERFTEAFWRSDKVRTSRDHSGLGLALSRAFAHLLGGSLQFSLIDEKTVVAVLRLSARDTTSD